MDQRTLLAVSGVSSLGAGALRVLNSFSLFEPGIGLTSLYVATDVLILLGLTAFYAAHSRALGRLGFTGLTLAIVGVSIIRTAGNPDFVAEAYPLGSGLLLIGLSVLAIPLWRTRLAPRAVAFAFWATLLLGAAGPALAGLSLDPALALTLAGLLFGVAFAGFGLAALSQAARPRTPSPGSSSQSQ